MPTPTVSIVIPIYNEEESLPPLVESLLSALTPQTFSYEIIFVNDGSRDGSLSLLEQYAAQHRFIKVIDFRRNFGQTAAMTAGFMQASGEIIIPMDGDNQNDPTDIPRLLEKMEEGFDVVSGWRKNRQDRGLTRVLPSKIANSLISIVSGVHLHDYGCTLKAYRHDVLEGVRLYGEMHRFIPIYASWQGGKVSEIVVNHHPRRFGVSKYNLSRTFRVILDLLLIKFMGSYSSSPIHFFGGFGLFSFGLSGLFTLVALWYKFYGNKSFIQTPLPLIVVLLALVGVLSIFIGFLAEILMRTYYESQGKSVYIIRKKINFESDK